MDRCQNWLSTPYPSPLGRDRAGRPSRVSNEASIGRTRRLSAPRSASRLRLRRRPDGRGLACRRVPEASMVDDHGRKADPCDPFSERDGSITPTTVEPLGHDDHCRSGRVGRYGWNQAAQESAPNVNCVSDLAGIDGSLRPGKCEIPRWARFRREQRGAVISHHTHDAGATPSGTKRRHGPGAEFHQPPGSATPTLSTPHHRSVPGRRGRRRRPRHPRQNHPPIRPRRTTALLPGWKAIAVPAQRGPASGRGGTVGGVGPRRSVQRSGARYRPTMVAEQRTPIQ